MQPGMQLTNTMLNEYAYDSEFPLQHPPEDNSSSGWDGLQETQDTCSFPFVYLFGLRDSWIYLPSSESIYWAPMDWGDSNFVWA